MQEPDIGSMFTILLLFPLSLLLTPFTRPSLREWALPRHPLYSSQGSCSSPTLFLCYRAYSSSTASSLPGARGRSSMSGTSHTSPAWRSASKATTKTADSGNGRNSAVLTLGPLAE